MFFLSLPTCFLPEYPVFRHHHIVRTVQAWLWPMPPDDLLSNAPAVSRMKPGPGAVPNRQLADRQLFWRLKELNSISLARPVPAGLRDTSSALSAATGCPGCYLDINKLCWSVTNSRSRWLFFNVCSTDHLPTAQSNPQNDWQTAFNPAYIFYAVVVWSISHCKARRSSDLLDIREESLFSSLTFAASLFVKGQKVRFYFSLHIFLLKSSLQSC